MRSRFFVVPSILATLVSLTATALPAGAALAVQDPASGTAGAQESTALDSLAQDTLVQDTVDLPEAISDERSATDEEIRSSLQAIFDRVDALANVTVEVEAGIVRLRGEVVAADVIDRAVSLAESQDGVLWVEDQVELSTSLAERLRPTWARLRDLAYGTLARLPLFVVALLIILLFSWAGGKLARWGGPAFIRSDNPFLRSILGRFIQTAVVIAGLLLVLDLLEATALFSAVIGTAGLAGLAIGFAFKDIVENYLAGLLLALQRPFDKNDHIVLESHEGKVVRLTPRETILMTLEGNHVRLPNAIVFRNPMLNYTRNPLRRFSFDAGVGPEDDLSAAREEGIAVLRAMTGVLDDPAPEAIVVDLGDSWVTVRFMGWVDQREADFTRVRSEAIRLVKLRLEEMGISLPSPEFIIRTADVGSSPVPPRGPRSTEPAPAGAPNTSEAHAPEQADVSPNDTVDRQIAEDRRVSSEEDLLESG